jgi:hypothetical protein
MSSIIRREETSYHGISVFGRGVFTNDAHSETYAGQYRDGHACGLGVLTRSDGKKTYTEHGPNGKCDGRSLGRWASGKTGYWLYERDSNLLQEFAGVYSGGTCTYNGVACAPDDPRLLALIAQVAPVEVRPTAATLTRPSTPSHLLTNQPALFALVCPRRRWRPPWPPRCTPAPQALVAVRHSPTAAALQSTTTQ